ncbi:hypothetical protein TcasGA2_TC032151 [Tribolium castaneum]|uniref:Spaetzle domain-containing protein n=1 Tax=Tribolium castaneum TaxID=7070 RepID=A0A139WMX7_TRICA|nr:hypothetical protein TcasGA2_TC032151 [Tribolium castaneum]
MWVKCVFVCVYFMTMEVSGIQASPAWQRNNHIVFPNSLEEHETFIAPKCSGNKTFCEDVGHYPKNKFSVILENTTYGEDYFMPQSTAEEESIKNRLYGVTEYYICNSHVQTQYPKVAQNVRNEWKYVYNFDNYKQGVRTEECVAETACRSFQGTPREVRTKCMQKYSDMLLLVADEYGKPVWDLFWFPSACPRWMIARVCTFPDSSEIGGDFLYETVVPNCQNHTYCEHLDRYPKELFSKILKSREKEFSRYFQSMAVIEPIMSRNQDTSCICASRKSIIYPKAAYNIKNNLKFIYNFDGYKQGVSVEVCVIWVTAE